MEYRQSAELKRMLEAHSLELQTSKMALDRALEISKQKVSMSSVRIIILIMSTFDISINQSIIRFNVRFSMLARVGRSDLQHSLSARDAHRTSPHHYSRTEQ